MTIQTLKGGIFLPTNLNWYLAPSIGNMCELWSSGQNHAGVVFRAPKTGTLDKFEFRIGTVFSAQNLKCSFQDVSLTTGFPDETADQYRVISSGITSNTWQVPGLITSDGTDGGTKRAVTRGDLVAAVVEWDSAVGDIVISGITTDGNASAMIGGFPRPVQKASSTWTMGASPMIVAIKYDDGTYAYISPALMPFKTITAQSFASNSTPDERGIYFKLPFTASVSGAWARIALTGDTDFVLYGSDGTTVLASASLDKDLGSSSGSATGYMVFFGADVTLTADTFYRLVIKPTTTTSMTLYDFDVNAAAIMDAIDLGQNCYHTQRTDAGSWSETTTKRPFMGLILNGADVTAGGGGNTYSRGRVVNQ